MTEGQSRRTSPPRARKGVLATLGTVALLLVVVLLQRGLGDAAAPLTPGPTSAGGPTSAAPSPVPTAGPSGDVAGRDQDQVGTDVDPETGLAWVRLEQLPPEATDVVERIEAGGPFRYDQDGRTFNNFEGLLPEQRRGFYREYTVPTPGERDRGARRIVTGDDDTQFFWTADHYESFERIQR